MRILWIDPIGTDIFREPTLDLLQASSQCNATVDFISLSEGQPLHLEEPSSEDRVIPEIMQIVRASAEDYDGILIGCFFDTALNEAKKANSSCVVTAPCEATTQIAINSNQSFSILCGRDSWKTRILNNLETYGVDGSLCSIRSIGMGVYELANEPDKALKALEKQGRLAIENDGAEVLILGCTADYHSHKVLQDQLQFPILDAIVAPYQWLESQITKRNP